MEHRAEQDAEPIVAPGGSVSVIIEWDNARISELERARAMYRTLVTQIRGLIAREADSRHEERTWGPFEIVLLYDPLEIDVAFIEGVTGDPSCSLPPEMPVQLVPAPGLGYYQLKNEGLKRAVGRTLVFLDSDVIPESDWLAELLRSFADPAVSVVGGSSYVEPTSVYNRAFALGWFFPLRGLDGPVVPTPYFFANNVAMRRQVFERFPFPDDARFRGQCSTLADTMRTNAVVIHQNPQARVGHPPPQAGSHFVCRALSEGHDIALSEDLAKLPRRGRVRRTYTRFRESLREAWYEAHREQSRVGLSARTVPVAVGILACYYGFRGLGEILTYLDPRIVRRYFHI